MAQKRAPVTKVKKSPKKIEIAKDRGRPSGFKEEYIQIAKTMCEMGATDYELSIAFGVSVRTLYRWQASNDAFCQALKVGKDVTDDRVEQSLYHKAIGYSFESEKIFNHQGEIVRAKTVEHVPPDTTAAIFWLKNRRKEAWRDKHEIEKTENVNVTVTHVRDSLSRKLTRIAAAREAGSLAEQPVAGRA